VVKKRDKVVFLPSMQNLLTIGLYKPQIPPNTGNIARLCVALGAPLLVIGKTPIRFDSASLQRAGLDHWDYLNFKALKNFKEFYTTFAQTRVILVSKEGKTNYWEYSYQPGDLLLFGNETRGLPPAMFKVFNQSVSIPMWDQRVRSLNLSNSVSLVAYEAMRQFALKKKIDKDGERCYRNYYTKTDNR